MFSVSRYELENQRNDQNDSDNNKNTYLSKVENKIKKLKKKKKEESQKNKKIVKESNIKNKENSVEELNENTFKTNKEKNENENENENNDTKKRKIEIEIENNDEITDDNLKIQPHFDKKKRIEQNSINIKNDKNRNKKEKKSLLGLPEWLAKPILISPYIEKNEENDINNPKFYLSKTVISSLNQMKITHLFPVQTSVLPFLLSTPTSTRMTGDLCVSAPTGSGKTLAYVLPIIETLSKRIIQRLRALIILPTRDLVAQVKETFNYFTRKTNLKVIAITGSISFSNEQSQLIDEKTGNCKVDIVIATPGRLIDHLNGTPGFTLSHLRYLIIDEADRLLNQHYQDWLNQVLNCINSISKKDSSINDKSSNMSLFKNCINNFNINELGLPENTAKTYRKNTANLVTDINYDYLSNENRINHCTPVQKLLFSATLTRNPAKIASLQLFNPTYISVSTVVTNSNKNDDDNSDINEEISLVDSHYVIPPDLHEFMMICKDSGQKPLALFHLLYNSKIKNALCFTNSLESAHRLGRLIHIFNKLWEKKIKEDENEDEDNKNAMDIDRNSSKFQSITTAVISSEMPLVTRRKILHSDTLPTIIICSDIMARGLDLSNDLSFDFVINYEIPNRPKTYVHRVGRTARAGREGQAISIVEAREARWFKDMMSRIDREENKKVKKKNFKDKDINPFYEIYNESLKELKEEVYQKKFNKDNKKLNKTNKKIENEQKEKTNSNSESNSSSSSESESENESDSISSLESESENESDSSSSSESESENESDSNSSSGSNKLNT
ncbi:P-loop containing nucleoside triphosphate hydrolase protein [Anaeromyces robustus]|uniref:ATP-dependent RNA helicase n=1 Tax=Anaeromyces robustus TaxID=1754192 RepID=A0A1Y1WRE4_9FUNG|nr:P-loop containing nucleoside triphosphate hydrolase protein [Anaeromyces robustus]|eukprot:ORX76100.1 P-loop containing nucleoside triphosphate hydrolase protein [Anaeromyces robustus]